MRTFCLRIFGIIVGILPLVAYASESDSVKVESLLREATVLPADSNRVLFFALNLLDVPYVANTLDETDEEVLTVHLDKLDCTTFVETVLALYQTYKNGATGFGSYRQSLQYIRYWDGKLDGYASRLHYFSDWIKNNEQKGIVYERTKDLNFVAVQTLNLDFMSTHPDSYRQLKNNPQLTARIAEIEQVWKDVHVCYIPKDRLNASPEELGIKNGDILAITTRIKGLDVVHVGFAVWMGKELHLLHASSIMKKVILDPQSLYDYSINKKAHTGVRAIHIL